MERDGLDALVVAGHGSQFNRGYIRYFADTHLWAGDSLILIPLDGDPVQVLVTYSGASMPDKLWIEDFRSAPDPQSEIVKAINEKGLTKGTIGIAGLHKVLTVGAYDELTKAFPNVNFVSADMVIDRLRAIKSRLELQQIRDLWELSKKAIERFVEVIGPGVNQREAVAEVSTVFRAGGCFDDMNLIHEGSFAGLPQDVPLKCDDLVGFHLEICGESGHWSELNIVCAFREPTALEQKLMDTELRAYEEVRRVAKPGVLLSEMADTFHRAILEDGWKLGEPSWHYYFHGTGMDSVEWPYFSAMIEGNRDVPLEEGMVFSYHPHSDTVPAVGETPRIFDDIVITTNGAERLSGNWDLAWRIMS